jgi:hypothetical protein
MTADLPRYPGRHTGLTAAARVALSNNERAAVGVALRGRITGDGWRKVLLTWAAATSQYGAMQCHCTDRPFLINDVLQLTYLAMTCTLGLGSSDCRELSGFVIHWIGTTIDGLVQSCRSMERHPAYLKHSGSTSFTSWGMHMYCF